MFYGLATHKLETDGLKFEHMLKDIQTLNEDAKNGVFDVTAISFTRTHMSRTSTRSCRTVRRSATSTVRSSSHANPARRRRSAR